MLLSNFAAEGLKQESAAKVKAPSGLGKGQPLPLPKGSSQTARLAQVAEICTKMAKLLQASDDCRVCLRERSGLDRLCALLSQVCIPCPKHSRGTLNMRPRDQPVSSVWPRSASALPVGIAVNCSCAEFLLQSRQPLFLHNKAH